MFLKKVVFRNLFIIAGILSLITIAGILSIKSFLPPLLPVFYGKPSGAEQLASTYFIFLIPSVSILITALNLFINSSAKEVFIKKIVAIVSLVASLMAAITVFKIVLLVGFF